MLQPVVALTGAGISSESGIPTFRGPEGIWRNHRPETLATPEAFVNDPRLVWEFYAWRMSIIKDAEPNLAHKTLAQIEAALPRFTLITQNVDGFHQLAGNQNVLELHGSLWQSRCTRCFFVWPIDEVPSLENLPSCPKCDGMARPAVVWFGEALPDQMLALAYSAALECKMMLVIGTSAVVQPSASLPLIAKQSGARIVEINPEVTPISSFADEVLQGPAAEELPRWWTDIQTQAI